MEQYKGHTPGPWHVSDTHYQDGTRSRLFGPGWPSGDMAIAECSVFNAQDRANVKLMAAAPDLLAEVASLREALEAHRDLTEAAWGIIANAEGGDWKRAPLEWQKAATRWRGEYFSLDAKARALLASKTEGGGK